MCIVLGDPFCGVSRLFQRWICGVSLQVVFEKVEDHFGVVLVSRGDWGECV